MKKLYFLVFLILFFSMAVSQSTALACDKKCQRKIAKAIKDYTKYIDRAENESCNTDSGKSPTVLYKKCTRDLGALDKRYDKYSDVIKGQAEIKALRVRHLELKDRLTALEGLNRIEELAKPYERKIKKVEGGGNCSVDKSQLHDICLQNLEEAEAVYNDIPPEDRKHSQVVDLKKRFDELVKIQKEMVAIQEKKSEHYSAVYELQVQFQEEMKAIDSALDYLKQGKENERLRSTKKIEELDAALPQVDIFSQNCTGKYAEVVEATDAAEVCELAKNAKAYRDRAVTATYKHYLDERIKNTTKVVQTLKTHGYIGALEFKRLMYNFDSDYQDVVKEVTAAYASASIDPPSFDGLKSQKTAFDDALKNALSSNKWNESEYFPVPGLFKEMAVKMAQKRGLELVEIGFTSEGWGIVKNDYGIPLRKINEGKALLKKTGEPFYRLCHVRFSRTYDGNEYADASDLEIISTFKPVAK